MVNVHSILFLVLLNPMANELNALIHLLLTLLASDENIGIAQQTRVIILVTPHSIHIHLAVVFGTVELEE
jgi:hypothetical protein